MSEDLSIFNALWNPTNMGFSNIGQTLSQVEKSPLLNSFFPLATLFSSMSGLQNWQPFHSPFTLLVGKLQEPLPGLFNSISLSNSGILGKGSKGHS